MAVKTLIHCGRLSPPARQERWSLPEWTLPRTTFYCAWAKMDDGGGRLRLKYHSHCGRSSKLSISTVIIIAAGSEVPCLCSVLPSIPYNYSSILWAGHAEATCIVDNIHAAFVCLDPRPGSAHTWVCTQKGSKRSLRVRGPLNEGAVVTLFRGFLVVRIVVYHCIGHGSFHLFEI